MRKSQIWYTILSILAGGFLLASFFVDQPMLKTAGAEVLLWAERMFAALLFFAILDSVILQVRKAGDDSGMRIIRIIGFAAFTVVLLLGLIKGPDAEDYNNGIYLVQKTFESALAGLVCLSLIFAMYRLPSQAPSVMKTAFFIGLILFLAVYAGLPRMLNIPDIGMRILEWLRSIPRGAVSGLLMGIALGGLVTGIKLILFGKASSKEDK